MVCCDNGRFGPKSRSIKCLFFKKQINLWTSFFVNFKAFSMKKKFSSQKKCYTANAVSLLENRHFRSHRPHVFVASFKIVTIKKMLPCKRCFLIGKSPFSVASPPVFVALSPHKITPFWIGTRLTKWSKDRVRIVRSWVRTPGPPDFLPRSHLCVDKIKSRPSGC